MRKSRVHSINLWLTDYCNRNCEYCLARDLLSHSRGGANSLDFGDLDKIVGWIKNSSGLSENISIIGGEPTTHPRFLEIIKYLFNQGLFPKNIFTNGLFETDLIDRLEEATTSRQFENIHFVVNVDHPSKYSQKEWALLRKNLERLSTQNSQEVNFDTSDLRWSQRLNLAITLFEANQSYDYILDLAREFEVYHIRSGVSKPSTDLTNKYVDIDQLADIKDTVINYVEDCVENGIRTGFECVLVPCAFEVEEWNYLKNFTCKLDTTCNFPFDVFPDLTVSHCCALYDVLGEYRVGDNIGKIDGEILKKRSKIQSKPLDRCQKCDFFEQKICQGGCLKLKLKNSN